MCIRDRAPTAPPDSLSAPPVKALPAGARSAPAGPAAPQLVVAKALPVVPAKAPVLEPPAAGPSVAQPPASGADPGLASVGELSGRLPLRAEPR
eukprot:14048211-Alexandrium_andersonii.AAC.1